MVEAAGIEASDGQMSSLDKTQTTSVQKPHNLQQNQADTGTRMSPLRTELRQIHCTMPTRTDTRSVPNAC